MNRIIAIVMVLLIGSAGAAQAQRRTIEHVEIPLEIMLGELKFPSDATGNVEYRPCANCSVESRRLTEQTTYRLNGRMLPFAEFIAAVDDIRSTPSVENRTIAGVFMDINTERVLRVVVRVGGTR